MTLDAMQTALNEFETRGGKVTRLPVVDSSVVTQVQEAIGLTFPPELIEYYGTFDYLQFGPDEMLTLEQSAREFNTCSGGGLAARKTPLWPVLDDGSGGYFFVVCMYAGRARPTDFGRVYYNPGCEPGTLEYIAVDIFALVKKEVATAIEFLD